MIKIRGRERIKILKTLVHKGQRIYCSDIVSQTTTPTPGAKTARFRLMSTPTDTDDPDHPSVTLLETIKMTNPNIEKSTVSLQFGGTDILMKAVDHDTGNEVHAMVQF